MSDFLVFYVSGGLFNHAITIGLGVAVAALVFYLRANQRGDAGGSSWLLVCDRALLTCVGLGLLGSSFGAIDASAALASAPPEAMMPAAAQAAGLVVIPLAWALLGSIPVWIASTVFQHRRLQTK